MGTRATTEELIQVPGERESAAVLLQWEYARWRRDMGFDPPAERLNRWHLAWDELGEALACA